MQGSGKRYLGSGSPAANQRPIKDEVGGTKWKEEKGDHKMILLYKDDKPMV